MARLSRVADSDESETNSVESLDPRNSRKPTTKPNRNPVSALAHQSGESVKDSIETNDNLDEDGDEIAMDGDGPQEEADDADDADEVADNTIVVMVPGPRNPEEYVPYQDDTVYSVLEEINGSDGETLYRVEYEDERQENKEVKLSGSNFATNFAKQPSAVYIVDFNFDFTMELDRFDNSTLAYYC
ncbi:hypothetical protein BOTNAR_0036g00500 [Botryotinia narcissicola]|uniref:Uncharacterized protein n=1 Tax=Botryotinia narcissicola TaxID=278944 RepID=A0A4Z1JF07_9HELO|nr:hypothetical protein BOTNAR_0036g00500 [Botryotinia narcissicola]